MATGLASLFLCDQECSSSAVIYSACARSERGSHDLFCTFLHCSCLAYSLSMGPHFCGCTIVCVSVSKILVKGKKEREEKRKKCGNLLEITQGGVSFGRENRASVMILLLFYATLFIETVRRRKNGLEPRGADLFLRGSNVRKKEKSVAQCEGPKVNQPDTGSDLCFYSTSAFGGITKTPFSVAYSR
ncbi:hypothetical protein V9T40_012172 [Parthenolecanium corni]|uniref:Uncharacterized protein n=1 Tax=Parthenolecanium corni TaxID=536013 RepID=A0AAN9TMN3_9HEMI